MNWSLLNYVPKCALVPHGPHALRALVLYVTCALCAVASNVPRALCVLVPCVPHFLRALVSHVPHTFRVLVTHVTSSLCVFMTPCLVSHVLCVLCALILCANITFCAREFPCFTLLYFRSFFTCDVLGGIYSSYNKYSFPVILWTDDQHQLLV